MSTLKVDTIKSDTTPTVTISDGLSVTGVTTSTGDISIADTIVHTGDTNTKIRFPSVDTITAETSGSERFRITSDGKYSFGAGASPTTTVDIKVTDTTAYSAGGVTVGQNQLRINNAGASGVAGIRFDAEPSSGSAGYASIRTIAPASGSADLIFSTRHSSTFAERLRIHSDGQVTIGNDASGAGGWDGDLVVANTNGGRITVGDTVSSEKFAIAANGDINLYSYKNGDNINFHTTDGSGTANRLRIDDTGKLLLGDTTTAWNSASDGYKMSIKESANENGAIRFLDSDAMVGGVAGIAKGAGQIVSGTANVDGVFGSTYNHTHLISGDGSNSANASIKMTVHTEGNVEILDGDLIMGTAGHGIDFSATSAGSGSSSASELLDDYEEGSWTPSIALGGFTLSTQHYNKYVKIGNLVHIQMYFSLSGTGDSNSLRFDGLPYAVPGNGYSVGTVDFGYGGKKGVYPRTRSGTSQIDFYYSSENASNSRIDMPANLVGAGYVIATLSYYTE